MGSDNGVSTEKLPLTRRLRWRSERGQVTDSRLLASSAPEGLVKYALKRSPMVPSCFFLV